MKVPVVQEYDGIKVSIPRVLLDEAGVDRAAAFVEIIASRGKLVVTAAKSAPKTAKSIDPLFGPLTLDGRGWVGCVDLPPLGKGLRFWIEQDGRDGEELTGPSERQRKAWKAFKSSLTAALKRADQANLAYYQQYRDENRDETDSRSRRQLPPVKNVEQLRKLLTRPSLRIPFQPNRQWAIEIIWNCRWDPEHGHRVELWNGKVQNVGSDAAF